MLKGGSEKTEKWMYWRPGVDYSQEFCETAAKFLRAVRWAVIFTVPNFSPCINVCIDLARSELLVATAVPREAMKQEVFQKHVSCAQNSSQLGTA